MFTKEKLEAVRRRDDFRRHFIRFEKFFIFIPEYRHMRQFPSFLHR